MGHTARRAEPYQGPPNGASDQTSAPKKTARLELLPEEALYLLEKGSLQCWKQEGDDSTAADGRYNALDGKDIGSAALGTPMSLQQAYAEMIGRDDLSLERYQVRPSKPPSFQMTHAPLVLPDLRIPQTSWICDHTSRGTTSHALLSSATTHTLVPSSIAAGSHS
jgi:hypothetical protein